MKNVKISIALAALAGIAGAQNAADTSAAVLKEKIEALEGKLTGLEENYLETKTTVGGLAKLKIGGLVQVRMIHNMDTGYISAAPNQQNYFMVRRGRMKATYDAGNGSQWVMQFDIKEKGLSAQDIYTKWDEPWLKMFSIQAGMQDIPFGYEIGYSSSGMEYLERSTFERNSMFKDEKDIGAILGVKAKIPGLDDFGLKLAYLNGAGLPGTQPASTQDPSCFVGRLNLGKDLVDAGVGLGFGASYYHDSRKASTGGFYYQVDGSATPRKSGSNSKDLGADILGADAQMTADMSMVPGLAGAKIMTELYTGTAVGTKSNNQRSVLLTDTLYQRDVLGWYVAYVQNVGKSVQAVVRYDVYDPNTNVDGDKVGTNGTSSADMMYNNWYFGLNWFATGNLKFTVGYDLIQNETSAKLASSNPHKNFAKDVDDDVLTLQGQFAF